MWAVAGGNNQDLATAIQFSPQLPAALSASAVHRIASGGSTTDCPGMGQAAPGQLCIYERATADVIFNTVGDPATGSNGANRRGAEIEYIGAASGVPFADGTWAVRAP